MSRSKIILAGIIAGSRLTLNSCGLQREAQVCAGLVGFSYINLLKAKLRHCWKSGLLFNYQTARKIPIGYRFRLTLFWEVVTNSAVSFQRVVHNYIIKNKWVSMLAGSMLYFFWSYQDWYDYVESHEMALRRLMARKSLLSASHRR